MAVTGAGGLQYVEVAACRLSEVSPPDMDPLYEGVLEPLFPYAEQLPFEISWYLRQHRSPIAPGS